MLIACVTRAKADFYLRVKGPLYNATERFHPNGVCKSVILKANPPWFCVIFNNAGPKKCPDYFSGH
jgi:hypothetical protein